MRRFFLNQPLQDTMEIAGGDAYHITRVLRMQVGDKVILVTSTQQAIMIITAATTEKVIVKLEQTVTDIHESPLKLFLVQGLPKGDKMELIIQKAAELGVTEIYPFTAEHSVVRYDSAKQADRRQRWQKIAHEAAKQCGRDVIPVVEPIRTLAEILNVLSQHSIVIMLYEGQNKLGLKQVIQKHHSDCYTIIIGPEGGFSQDEVVLVKKYGGQLVSVGPRILRTETAALAALSIIQYELGDLGG